MTKVQLYPELYLATAILVKFTEGKVKVIKGKREILIFCPFCLRITINFYFEAHKSNIPIKMVLLISILLYIEIPSALAYYGVLSPG